jgi:predicted ATP-dependent Lon-type protease
MKFKTKEEFELYALMYVASLDFKVTKDELAYMSKGVAAETYQHVSEMFQADNDAETVESILQGSAAYLPTDELKADFINKLKDLAKVDSLHPMELASLSSLEKLIYHK